MQVHIVELLASVHLGFWVHTLHQGYLTIFTQTKIATPEISIIQSQTSEGTFTNGLPGSQGVLTANVENSRC